MRQKTLSKTKLKIKKPKQSVALTVLEVIFFLYSLTLIFPVAWLIYNSVKDKMEFFLHPWNFPTNILKGLSNYTIAFKEFGLAKMLLTTLILSFSIPFISIFCTACTAYAYGKVKFKGRELLYAVAMIPMIVSIAGTQSATYRLLNDLGLFDNYGILLMYTGGFGINFMLLASVFTNISESYREAAEVDGAGRWRIFLTIYLPQASKMLIAMYVLAFIGTWNNYETVRLYMPSYENLATGVRMLEDRMTIGNDPYLNDYPKLYATMVLAIVPVLVLFGIFQNQIMKIELGGGVKE